MTTILKRTFPRKAKNRPLYHGMIFLALMTLVLSPQMTWIKDSSNSAGLINSYIVQANDAAVAKALSEHAGGKVTRELGIINAVAADLSAGQAAFLKHLPAVKSVWLDASVRTSDTADPGVIYAPVSGGEAKPASFDPNKLTACDGLRASFDTIPLNTIAPQSFQGFGFAPAVNPTTPPYSVT
jgi:hypothetical protein